MEISVMMDVINIVVTSHMAVEHLKYDQSNWRTELKNFLMLIN